MASKAENATDSTAPGTGVELVDSAGELAELDDGTGAVELFMEALTSLTADDPADIERRIMADTARAQTPEALFEPRVLTSWKANQGVPYLVRGVRWNPSTLEGETEAYAVIDAVNMDTGEPTMLQTSSRQSMFTLFLAAHRGWFPLPLMMVASKQSARGFTPLHLELANLPT